MAAIAHVVEGRRRDLGGFEVLRILPWAGGRMVGPFIFLDQMGPAVFAPGNSRVALLGGAPVGERQIWWNFVSSSQERIERAKADWKAGRFAPVPGETESIPLPDR